MAKLCSLATSTRLAAKSSTRRAQEDAHHPPIPTVQTDGTDRPDGSLRFRPLRPLTSTNLFGQVFRLHGRRHELGLIREPLVLHSRVLLAQLHRNAMGEGGVEAHSPEKTRRCETAYLQRVMQPSTSPWFVRQRSCLKNRLQKLMQEGCSTAMHNVPSKETCSTSLRNQYKPSQQYLPSYESRKCSAEPMGTQRQRNIRR